MLGQQCGAAALHWQLGLSFVPTRSTATVR